MAEGPQESAKGLIGRLEAAVRGIGVFACWVLLPAQVAVGTFYVVARQFYTFQLTPLQELEWHCFFALVFLCLGMTHLADRNVRIDIFRARFGERTRNWIEIAGYVLALLPFASAMIYFGGANALAAFVSGERSRAALGLADRWIIKSFIPLGGVLLLIAGTVMTIRNIRRLRRARAVDADAPPAAP